MNTPLPPTCPKCGAALPVDAPKGLCPRCLAAMNFATETVLTGADALAAQPPLSPAELAPHFPQLEIIECLGRGGMGVVYKARQKSLNRVVALKLLAPERASDAKFAQRFTHEAQALAVLNHPSIVTIYDFGQAGGFYFLLMEFVDGVNLRQAMKAGRFTPEQALTVVPPVCEALQYAHEQRIVHRDIKPENLLLDKAGRVKIADFGIAKLLHADGSDVGLADSQPAGTPQYMAPEQKAHRSTDHRADIYSLGVVLYELLTGELPADKLQPPSRKVQIDVRLDEIVLRALETKPELRYQTAGEFRTQVETVVSTPASSQPEPAQTSSTLARLLKTGTSTLATPELLATLQGQFFAYHTRGQLILDDRQLTHSRGGEHTVIPLAAIRDLSIGQYPRMVNPAGIDFLSVTYEEGGQRKQVLLSPMKGWFALPSIFNAHIAEWHAAIREAVIAATGHAPASSQIGKIGTPIQSFVPLLALAAWLVPVAAALMMFTRRHETAGGFPGAVGLFEVAVFVICFSSVLLLFWLFSAGVRSTTSHSQKRRFLGLGLALAGLTLLLGAPVLNEFVDDHGLTATARKHLETRRRLGQAMTVARERTAIKAGELSVAEERFRDATDLDELKRQRRELEQLRQQLTERRTEADQAESALNQAALTKQVDEQQRNAWIQLFAGIVLALGCVMFLLGIDPAGRFRRARLALPLVPVLLLGFLFLKLLRHEGSPARPQLAAQGLAILSSVSSVEVGNDNAVVRQRRYDSEGMVIAFGTGTNHWTPGGLYLDAMFDITLGWPAFGHGANWTLKARHGIHASYRLDGPPGPMLGKIVFHPGTPAPEADGSYVIGEFRPDKGAPLPIAVRLEGDSTKTLATPPSGSSSQAVPSTQSTRRVGISFPLLAIVVGAVVLVVVGGSIALLLLLVRKGGAAGKTVLWVVGVMLLLFGISVFTLLSLRKSKARQESVRSELAERALQVKMLPATNGALVVPQHIEFKVLRVENPPGTHIIRLHFERDANYGLGFELWQTGLRGPRDEFAQLDFWKTYGVQRKWIGVNNSSMLEWRLPPEMSEEEVQAGAEEVEKNARRWNHLSKGAVLEFAHVKHRSGWTYVLIAEVLAEPELRALASKPTSDSNPNQPLSVTLPNGATVKLIGLSEYPTQGKSWWLPNGTECQPLFDGSKADIRSVLPAGERTVVCAFAIIGLKSGTGSEASFAWPASAMWSGRQFKIGVLQPEIKAVALNVPMNANGVHLRLTLDSAERFRLEYVTKPGSAALPGPLRLPLGEVGVTFANVSLRPGLLGQPSAVLLGVQQEATEAAAAEPWGEGVDGVQALLRAEREDWGQEEKPAFKLAVRNRGAQRVSVVRKEEIVEVEIDGRWYVWPGKIDVVADPLSPGGRFDGIAILLHPAHWKRREDFEPVVLKPGWHTVRVCMPLPAKSDFGPTRRVISNAIRINLLETAAPQPSANPQATHPKADAPRESPNAGGDPENLTCSFPLRHMFASDMVDQLRQILQGLPRQEAKPSADNQEVIVTGLTDVMTRVQTFITVTDWPDKIERGPNYEYPRQTVLRTARSFFYACAIEDAEEAVSKLLSLGVLAELKGDTKSKVFFDYTTGNATDAEWEKSLRADWPGKKEAVQRLVREWNRYPLKRITEDSGVAIGFGLKHFCSVSFEGAPKQFYRVTIEPGRTKSGTSEDSFFVGSLPPWWKDSQRASAELPSYQQFDQTPGQGWRALAEQKQFGEAARMIESYLTGRTTLTASDRVNLHFHAAQVLAFAGDAKSVLDALGHLKQARYAVEPLDAPLRWNDYVAATEAFLKGDITTLKAARERIAAGPKLNGVPANLDVVDSLVANIGKPYAEAYRVKIEPKKATDAAPHDNEK